MEKSPEEHKLFFFLFCYLTREQELSGEEGFESVGSLDWQLSSNMSIPEAVLVVTVHTTHS